jgi:aspartokinase-like uncharacterized kinase
MTGLPRRIIKLGGSLLDWPEWPERFEAWLARQPAAENLVLPGGGSLADAVREIDALYPLPPVAAHWLCIRAMSIHARQLTARWPAATLCSRLRALDDAAPSAGLVFLDPWPILRDEEPQFPGQPLPAGWDVTSDSIAARLAEMATAAELVLLKSSAVQEGESLAELSQRGFVDAYFPRAAGAVNRIRCVNLRDEAFTTVSLR